MWNRAVCLVGCMSEGVCDEGVCGGEEGKVLCLS